MQSRALFLTVVVSVFLVCVGCDRNGTAHREARPDLSQVKGSADSHSRVFDGRDSVATGIDGLTATQANFTIMTEFLCVESAEVDVSSVNPDPCESFSIESPPADEKPLSESHSVDPQPILAPDGEKITWGEFSGAEGAVIVKCTEQGTHSVVHLSGLIPKGSYSIWIDVFDAIGNRIDRFEYTETDEKGKSKGNVFRASGSGEGHTAGFVAPRVLGNGTEISSCMLDDVKDEKYNWRVVGIYHWGVEGTPQIGDENFGTFVEQIGFAFEIEEDEPIVE